MSVEAASLPSETTPRENLQRWIVLIGALFGLAVSVFGLVSVWRGVGGEMASRLRDTITLATEFCMFGIAWLIAWRAGRSAANLAIALAMVAIYLNGALWTALEQMGHHGDTLALVVNTLTYFLGATLFIRASQQFPRRITRDTLAASGTIWGRWKALRTVLGVLLRPAVLWPLIGAFALLDTFSEESIAAALTRLCIIALGSAYFYVNYRAGDEEGRRKVLWFLAWAITAAVISLVILAVGVVLGDGGSGLLRDAMSLALQLLANLAQLVCIAAAVFYAGALSPSLVIRKTVVFGLTTALLLFVFATVEVFLHHQIVHLLHVTDTLASSLIGGAFGLTFHPVKHYFERLVQRLFGGKPSH